MPGKNSNFDSQFPPLPSPCPRMKLYLLRHGQADWPDWSGDDDDRPLTREGIAEMRAVALALKVMKVQPDRVLASPLPRALRTAELAAEALERQVETHDGLRPGFGRAEYDAIITAHDGGDLMLVGHEPDLSELTRSLTGARVKFPKAATAAIEIDPDSPAPRLLWLFPARMLIRLSR